MHHPHDKQAGRARTSVCRREGLDLCVVYLSSLLESILRPPIRTHLTIGFIPANPSHIHFE